MNLPSDRSKQDPKVIVQIAQTYPCHYVVTLFVLFLFWRYHFWWNKNWVK